MAVKSNPHRPLFPALLVYIAAMYLIGQSAAGAVILLLGVICAGVLPQATLDKIGQVIFGAILFAICYVIYFVIQNPDVTALSSDVSPFLQMFALFWGTLFINRAFLKTAGGGLPASGFILFMGLLTLSVSRLDHTGILLIVSGAALILKGAPPKRTLWPRWNQRTQKQKALFLGLHGVLILIATGLIVYIPIGYQHALDRYLSRRANQNSGFSSIIALGEMKNILPSTKLVMRVYSERPQQPLRGKLYNIYSRGYWKYVPNPAPSEVTLPVIDYARNDVEIRIVDRRRKRFFLPLNAAEIFVDTQFATVDQTGILWPAYNSAPTTIRYATGMDYHFPIAPPNINDTVVPPYLKKKLVRYADRFSPEPKRPSRTMANLTAALQSNYKYTLSADYSHTRQPLVQFLEGTHGGHCEYFASALAMLGRIHGIPTRVANGYAVTEYNDTGNYWVIRERNAHAWVEAFTENNRWETFDPTPPGNLEYQSNPVTALFDLIPAYATKGLEYLGRIHLRYIYGTAAALAILWIAIRLIRKKNEVHNINTSFKFTYMRPPPELQELLRHLSRQHLKKGRSQSLESYTADLRQANKPDAADAISSYLAWRYGDNGELQTVKKQLRSARK